MVISKLSEKTPSFRWGSVKLVGTYATIPSEFRVWMPEIVARGIHHLDS